MVQSPCRAKAELQEFLESREAAQQALQKQIDGIKVELQAVKIPGFSGQWLELHSQLRKLEMELWQIGWKERALNRAISDPIPFDVESLKAYESANITRLGIITTKYSVTADTHRIDIPSSRHLDENTSVDLDLELETEESTVITELGELFIQACRVN